MKLFVGPMSKNIVDATLRFVKENPGTGIAGFIPSRRQIETEFIGNGYVNNWTTEDFVSYVRRIDKDFIIKRDHAGPGQGTVNDDGRVSLFGDVRSGIKYFHIDTWKVHLDAYQMTSKYMDFCHSMEKDCVFEIGTEEQIYKYTASDLDFYIDKILNGCETHAASNVRYAVIQSGTRISGMSNVGDFDASRSKSMCDIAHGYGLLAKEHNSDYLTPEQFRMRIDCGVDAFNIAPELGVLESRFLLSSLRNHGLTKELSRFIKSCISDKKWERWLGPDDYADLTLQQLAEVCGHYHFSGYYHDAIFALLHKGFNYNEGLYELISARYKEILFS